MLKKILRRLLTLLYRVKIEGLDNYKKAGDRVLIISNHTSFLDPLLLAVFLPDAITFAINTHISERWWLKPFLGLSSVFPMDPAQPLSLKALVGHLQQDIKTVIFPEGRITVTGSLMKIYDGAGLVADKSKAAILPVRIRGAEYTHFSRLRNSVRLRLFPKITIQILPHTRINSDPQLSGKSRRKYCGRILAQLMGDMIFATSHYQQTIFSGLLEARTIHGGKHLVVEDMARKPLSYNALITQTIALANRLRASTQEGEAVGVLLPNASHTLCVVLGLQLYGRVPAMLNFSAGSSGMISACKTAQVTTVISSRRFIKLGKMQADVERLGQHVKFIHLEDLAKRLTLLDKLTAIVLCRTANYWYQHQRYAANNPAVILFTSGSEGQPKGVVLSHANILANHNQLKVRIAFNARDVVLNFLPLFHSFGFTVGTMLPIINGMKTFFYPTPLHYSVIPEIAYDIGATIMFGTNTFLAAYGQQAHAYDFYTMRYVVAGAEKLHQHTRELWADKFGIRILEGYGVTEAAPVLSVNTPMDFKAGTVGRLLPDIDYRIEPVAGIAEGGQLHVFGPNIMLGYLLSEQPGHLVPPTSRIGKGWHDTGDIVARDEDGFISIKGRSKRFAKVSGEMVSLAAVEAHAAKAWPNAQHAATQLPDAKKGEQVILLTTQQDATSQQLASAVSGVHAIGLPKKIIPLAAIPLLATGKVNYPQVAELAASKLKASE